MSRDPKKLRFYALADELVLEIYELSNRLPPVERFGLQSQMRRAAVSVMTNLVEGSARTSDASYRHFLEVSLGSATETRYLVELCGRLELISVSQSAHIAERYTEVIKATQSLISAIARSS